MFRLKVMASYRLSWDFAMAMKNTVVLCGHHSHSQKALPCAKTHRLSHQTINISSGVLFTCGSTHEKSREVKGRKRWIVV